MSPHGDEPLYSAYVNALIDGRTRKNDPFGGRDSSAEAPLPESIFSIQFMPAYAIALPGADIRRLGLNGLHRSDRCCCLTCESVCFLVTELCYRRPSSSCGGNAIRALFWLRVGRYGFFGTFLDIGFPPLPFLRRYQPAVAVPFILCISVIGVACVVLVRRTSRARSLRVIAGLTLAVLIFSHLYLWTASAAWLACIGALWLYFRPAERSRKRWLVLTTIGVITAIALVAIRLLTFPSSGDAGRTADIDFDSWPGSVAPA